MERHNRRLYRIARSILRNDSEAEDVVQEAYITAFTRLGGFRGDSSLATWLSRITMNEALGRLRRQRPTVDLEAFEAQRTEVFMTRVIEGMSTEDTANLLGLQPHTVKTRLHRARRLVRDELDKQIGPVLTDAFPFAGRRCERMTNAVLHRLILPG
jgi:RNA polymerase sigma-70 factor (ECF subfamily)